MTVSVQRYEVNSKTLVGRLVPFFLRGRRMLLFLSAVSSPLDSVNRPFLTWARNTIIDAATTSQVIVMKWMLKSKLQGYFKDSKDEFEFDTYDRSNYATLYENQAEQLDHPEIKKIYMPENASETLGEGIEQVIIRDRGEITSESNEIRIIAPPHNSKISDAQYEQKIRQCVEPYIIYDVEYQISIIKDSE